MEAPLTELDPLIEDFATRHNMTLSRNYHNWPERSLVAKNNLRRLLQIYLENERLLTFNVWICASEDRANRRYWKNSFLTRAATATELRANLREWLDRGYAELMHWQSADLEFATEIAAP